MKVTLTPLTEEGLIWEAQQQFQEAMTRGTEALQRIVGPQGESWEVEVHWNPRAKIWACFEKEPNRFWNAFGAENAPKVRLPKALGDLFASPDQFRTRLEFGIRSFLSVVQLA